MDASNHNEAMQMPFYNLLVIQKQASSFPYQMEMLFTKLTFQAQLRSICRVQFYKPVFFYPLIIINPLHHNTKGLLIAYINFHERIKENARVNRVK